MSRVGRTWLGAVWIAVLSGTVVLAGHQAANGQADSTSTAATESPPGGTPETLAQAVDHFIDAKLRSVGVAPAAGADDATIVRRTTLDLAGRVPTTTEAQEYVHSTAADKRQRLVERLLQSPDFSRHRRNELDSMLMPRRGGGDDAWRKYLLEACQQNVPWDKLFRELMLASEENPVTRPGLQFLKSRVDMLDDMTRDTARLFFGVDISCAKCHDHPLVDDWKQDHYYGMASFFNRTVRERDYLAERETGLVKFKTTAGEEKTARLMFLTGQEIAEPSHAAADSDRKRDEADRKAREQSKLPPPAPQFSRRAALVEVGLGPEGSRFFARSIVNRTWAQLFGRGLVMPLEQMHSANPSSHPELLDFLAQDLIAHGYDLRRLVHGLVLSGAYVRSSQWYSAAELPDASLFALAETRPLTPRQYGLSLVVSTLSGKWLADQVAKNEWPERLADLEGRASGLAQQIELPDPNFQVSISEALLLSNGSEVEKNYLTEGDDRLVGQLKKAATPGELIEAAYWAVLSRPPQSDEAHVAEQYLAARADRPVQACQQVVWALLTSAEFRFNH